MERSTEQTVEQLLQALEARGIPMPHEMGTFLALQVCEAIQRVPLQVGVASVWIGDDASVGVDGAPAVDARTAAQSVLALLSELLVRSAQGVPPLLMELVEQAPGDSELTLGALRDSLEAALVPLNRAATTRVLVRLLRESRRPLDAEMAATAAWDADDGRVGGALDALLGADASRGPAAADVGQSRPPTSSEADLDAFIYASRAGASNSAAAARPALRSQEDYNQLREGGGRRASGAFGLYASATGLVATAALLWYVTTH